MTMMEATLTPQERHELLRVLRQLDPSAPPEKRRTVRRKTLINIKIQRIGDGSSTDRMLLVNASVRGAGFLAKTRLSIGETFQMHLRFDEGGGWLVLCEVRNCRKLQSGHYKVGV